MSAYRCYFLDAADRFIGPAIMIEASHDDAAIEHAKRMCAGRPKCVGFELWLGVQRIGRRDVNPDVPA